MGVDKWLLTGLCTLLLTLQAPCRDVTPGFRPRDVEYFSLLQQLLELMEECVAMLLLLEA